MNRPLEPVGRVNQPRLRLDTGVDVLDAWADRANNEEKNAVYAALFAMADRTLLRTYRIVEDEYELSEFFVLLGGDLVVKMRVHSYDSFGLLYVGPRAKAPGMTGNHDRGKAA
jgi:phosphoribosylaminoimidazole carboxylase (NCAIR synthetase)